MHRRSIVIAAAATTTYRDNDDFKFDEREPRAAASPPGWVENGITKIDTHVPGSE